MTVIFKTWSGLSKGAKRDLRKKKKEWKKYVKENTSEITTYFIAKEEKPPRL